MEVYTVLANSSSSDKKASFEKCKVLGTCSKSSGTTQISTSSKAADNAKIKSVFNQVFVWSGIICVLIVVISGFMYTISAGDPGRVSKAKNTMIYAFVGLIIIISAFGIVNFVLGAI